MLVEDGIILLKYWFSVSDIEQENRFRSRGKDPMRRWKLKHPTAYLANAGSAAGIGGDEVLDARRLPFDFMLNALRLNEGVPLTMFEARTGLPRSAIAAPLALARERGLLEVDETWLRPTELGRRFANDVIGLFLT